MVRTPPTTKGRQVVKIGALSYAQLIKYMLEGAYTCKELAEHTGLHYLTVLHYTRELHKAGAARISSWEKDARGRDVTRVYTIGAGKDAKRQALTSAERTARYRAKINAGQMMQIMAGGARFVQAGNGRLRFEAAT